MSNTKELEFNGNQRKRTKTKNTKNNLLKKEIQSKKRTKIVAIK